jgi:hypothetical protein
MNASKLQRGAILSETSFYTVEEVQGSTVHVRTDDGQQVKIGTKYIEDICNSADQFSKSESLPITKLAELFINSPRVAMTVAFYKKAKAKTKTALKKEKEEMVTKIANAPVSKLESYVNELIENPILDVIPGDLRVMKGRHYGQVDDMGRVHFVDMEQIKGSDSARDARMRQVDPRTIQYLIVDGIKYELKK